MFLLRFFNELHFNIEVVSLIFIISNIILTTLRSIIFKKISILFIILTSIITVLTLFVNLNLIFSIIYLVLNIIIFIFNLISYIYSSLTNHLAKDKVIDYIKNNEFYYFLTINKKGKITNYSANLLNLLGNASPINKQSFPEILFENMNIEKLNGEELSSDEITRFKASLSGTTSKVKLYHFEFSAHLDKGNLEYFDGVIQPVYYKDKLISRNIYITTNKLELLNNVRKALIDCKEDLIHTRNELYALMSMTGGVVLYFDFLSKHYIATQAFLDYTGETIGEYTFPEFMKLIHPEDEKFYIEQAQTINSHSTTRIKFRLIIKDKSFNVLEDSIYLDGDDKLVSVIRVIKDDEEEVENYQALSTKEKDELVEHLKDSQIQKTLDEALDLIKDE